MMRNFWLSLFLLAPLAASAQSVQQSGNVTPGHAMCWATTGVAYDCGTPGGSSIVGAFTANDFVAVNGSGSLIDSGINPTSTSAWPGLQNFNGGATAPTRPVGDNTTYLATTAFVAAIAVSPTWGATYTAPNPVTAGSIGILSTVSNPEAVTGSPAELDHFRCSQANGGFNQYTMTGGQATVSCFEFQMQATAGSNSTSNMYGIIGDVNNLGAGTVAGLYGRGSAGSSSATGNVFAIKSGVNCGAALASCYLQQANIDTVTFGGVATAFFWGASLQGTQGSGSAHYGILLDNSVSYDQAQLEGYAVGTGNFLQFLTATGSSSLMSVDQFGDVVVSNGVDSTSKTTGSIVSTGGVGIGKNLYVGGPTLSLGAATPVTQSNYSFFTANGATGSGVSFQASATEQFRIQVTAGVANFYAQTGVAYNFQSLSGTTYAQLYPSGGLFLGASPSDPGAQNLQVAGSVTGGTAAFGASALGATTVSGLLRSTFGVPTIASGACGTGTNGTVAGTNQSGIVTIGATSTTTCTVSFSATLSNAPNSCVIFPGNAAAAAQGTTLARVGTPSTASWIITGSALASTVYSYICL